MNQTWDETQRNFVHINAEKMTDKQIATVLDKTLYAVRKQRQKMGLKKAGGRGICKLIDKSIIKYPVNVRLIIMGR